MLPCPTETLATGERAGGGAWRPREECRGAQEPPGTAWEEPLEAGVQGKGRGRWARM